MEEARRYTSPDSFRILKKSRIYQRDMLSQHEFKDFVAISGKKLNKSGLGVWRSGAEPETVGINCPNSILEV